MILERNNTEMYQNPIRNRHDVLSESSKMKKPKHKQKFTRRYSSSLFCKSFFVPFIHSVFAMILLSFQIFLFVSCDGFFDSVNEKLFMKSFHPIAPKDENNVFVFPSMNMDQIS